MHQLRYLLAYGTQAASRLRANGDHYVAVAAVVVGLLLGVVLVAALARVLAVSRGRARPVARSAPAWLVWTGLAAVLLAGYCALEGMEMVLEPQHPGGLAGVFGHGGWWALPASAGVAALLTLLVCGGCKLIAIAARLRHAAKVFRSALVPRLHCGEVAVPGSPLADCAAGRAPPVLPSRLRAARTI